MIYGNFATYFEKYVSQKKTFQTKVTHFFAGIEDPLKNDRRKM